MAGTADYWSMAPLAFSVALASRIAWRDRHGSVQLLRTSAHQAIPNVQTGCPHQGLPPRAGWLAGLVPAESCAARRAVWLGRIEQRMEPGVYRLGRASPRTAVLHKM